MVQGVCSNCKNEKNIAGDGKSKGFCKSCYAKLLWPRKFIICKRCERTKHHQAKGLCTGCYNSVFHIDKVRMANKIKDHNIDYETYKKTTSACVLCGFDKIVDLHHLDMNHKNNSVENLTGLCANHHRMAHHRTFQKEVFQQLKEKGFNIPEGYKDDNLFKNPSS